MITRTHFLAHHFGNPSRHPPRQAGGARAHPFAEMHISRLIASVMKGESILIVLMNHDIAPPQWRGGRFSATTSYYIFRPLALLSVYPLGLAVCFLAINR